LTPNIIRLTLFKWFTKEEYFKELTLNLILKYLTLF